MQVFTADIWQEVLEDTKGVLYIHKSKMVRQHNGRGVGTAYHAGAPEFSPGF
jgi:hypothetical protein